MRGGGGEHLAWAFVLVASTMLLLGVEEAVERIFLDCFAG